MIYDPKIILQNPNVWTNWTFHQRKIHMKQSLIKHYTTPKAIIFAFFYRHLFLSDRHKPVETWRSWRVLPSQPAASLGCNYRGEVLHNVPPPPRLPYLQRPSPTGRSPGSTLGGPRWIVRIKWARNGMYCWWFRNPKQPPGMYKPCK